MMLRYPEAQAITRFPPYHWFGYYDMPCWDASGRYVLSLGVSFQERQPTGDDVALIGLSDLETGAYRVLTETHAFNWQQDCFLYWLPSDPARKIVYNDRVGERFVSIVLDIGTGEKRLLGPAINDLGMGGTRAACLNLARIAEMRPGYGYAGLADPWAVEAHPAEDGVRVLDVDTGRDRLIVSMRQVVEALGCPDYLADAKVWFNHTLFNPTETRLAFLCRMRGSGERGWRRTVMLTVDPDGGNLRQTLPGPVVSHFDWRNEREILAWTSVEGQGTHFFLIDDRTGATQVVAPDLLTEDGHCSYSHNGRWILTDTYPDPDDLCRTLKVYIPAEDREVVVGRYLSPPPFVNERRCDLHPRWSPDDRTICFDSVHEGHRQVYLVDTSLQA